MGGEESGTGTGGGEEPTDPTDPSDPTDPADPGTSTGDYECHFSDKKPSNDFYNVVGNYSDSKGKFTAPNGTTYKVCLKIESSTSIKFKTTETMKLYLGFADGSTPNIKMNGVKVGGANAVIEKEIPAGIHTLTKADTHNLFYINLYRLGTDDPGDTPTEEAVGDLDVKSLSFNGAAILNPEGKHMRLYTVTGHLLGTNSGKEVSTAHLPKGMYLVVAEGETLRFVVK